MGTDKEVRQDHLSLAASLAIGRMGTGGQERGRLGDGAIVVEMGWQQLYHLLDALNGKAYLVVDDHIVCNGSSIQKALQMFFAPGTTVRVRRQHIQNHVGIHQQHQGFSPLVRVSRTSVLKRVRGGPGEDGGGPPHHGWARRWSSRSPPGLLFTETDRGVGEKPEPLTDGLGDRELALDGDGHIEPGEQV